MSSLPNPKQIWSHSTVTVQDLKDALNDPKITAIETDILMGHDITKKTENDESNDDDIQKEEKEISAEEEEPIMAHPPERESDLSFATFMRMTTNATTIQKHLKLDLKELKALSPILDTLGQCIDSMNPSPQDKEDDNKTIYLNADMLNGPGMRKDILPIEADEFLKPTVEFLKRSQKRQNTCAYSLGWKTDCRSFSGYTDEDIADMKKIIEDYELLKFSKGVVLAVNARVLSKNPKPFDSILKEYPQLHLLIWTGTGEPPISKKKIDGIQQYFETSGFMDQIGFDCQTAPTFLRGVFYDKAVETFGVLWNVRRFISQR